MSEGGSTVSRYDYERSRVIAATDEPFYALMMAAYRRADSANAQKIQAMWPDLVDELTERYHAPGGILPSDPVRHGEAYS
jgi:hypothetical protein